MPKQDAVSETVHTVAELQEKLTRLTGRIDHALEMSEPAYKHGKKYIATHWGMCYEVHPACALVLVRDILTDTRKES